MATVTPAAARRPRAYVRVQGPDAVDYLNRMLSNDVPGAGLGRRAAADAEGARDRAGARLAPRRGRLPAPDRARARRAAARQLTRMRFAAKCEIEAEEHTSTIVFGEAATGSRTATTALPAVEVLDADVDAAPRRRARAAADRGRDAALRREIDDRVLPAEAGLDERAISFTKGCYPGQEPIARQHYRGKVNRRCACSRSSGERRRPRRRSSTARRRSAASRAPCPGLALAYVRVEVPDGRRAPGRRRDGARQGLSVRSLPCRPSSTTSLPPATATPVSAVAAVASIGRRRAPVSGSTQETRRRSDRHAAPRSRLPRSPPAGCRLRRRRCRPRRSRSCHARCRSPGRHGRGRDHDR